MPRIGDVLERLRHNARGLCSEDPSKYMAGLSVADALEIASIIEAQAREIERLRCPLEKFERRIRQSSNDVDCALIARSLAEDLGIALTNTHPDKQGA